MAGIPTTILKSRKSANIKTFAAPYYSWEETVFAGGDYMPRKGDLVLFAWSGKSLEDANLSHTAIVYDVTQTEGRVILTVIHGNCNNSVMISDHRASISDGTVSGGRVGYFVAPNY